MSSHFYDRSGQLVEGLRAARKARAVPSPTTILECTMSYGLRKYFTDQIFHATIASLPPPDDPMNFEHWKMQVYDLADQHSKDARDKGASFHDWAQLLYLQWPLVPDLMPEWEPQCNNIILWFQENVKEVICVEQVVQGDGYAGRLDCAVLLKDGTVAIPDVKTQGMAKRKKFDCYSKWALQLAAYQRALERTLHVSASRLINLCVGSDVKEEFLAHQWPESVDYYYDIFKGLLAFWCLENNYYPTEEEEGKTEESEFLV